MDRRHQEDKVQLDGSSTGLARMDEATGDLCPAVDAIGRLMMMMMMMMMIPKSI